jgi:hypothetical protein
MTASSDLVGRLPILEKRDIISRNTLPPLDQLVDHHEWNGSARSWVRSSLSERIAIHTLRSNSQDRASEMNDPLIADSVEKVWILDNVAGFHWIQAIPFRTHWKRPISFIVRGNQQTDISGDELIQWVAPSPSESRAWRQIRPKLTWALNSEMGTEMSAFES